MAGKGGEVTKDVGMLDIAEVEDLKFEVRCRVHFHVDLCHVTIR
jgi:hypothetical protein